jgi:hypothetical protein
VETLQGKNYARAICEIQRERDSQIKNHGEEEFWVEQAHKPVDYLFPKLSILTEEIGELAAEMQNLHFIDHYARTKEALREAIQVAAVSLAIVEGLIEINGGWSPMNDY